MTMTIDMHTHVAPRQAVKIAESGGTAVLIIIKMIVTTSYGNLKTTHYKKMERQTKTQSMDVVKLICIY